jgi:hypothetical protein
MQPKGCDVRDGVRENREGEIPAPWLEEPEPDAIGMATVVSGSDGGVLPVSLR